MERNSRKISNKSSKKPSTRTHLEDLEWSDKKWKVIFGELKRTRGRPRDTESIFRAFGEKLPRGVLRQVERTLSEHNIHLQGVYFAHDSLGCARYAGRGSIFKRLAAHFKTHEDELLYFSFYIIKDKQHEREIETALIRIASHLLVFNTRKKRDDIQPGNVNDYEPGSYFFERKRLRASRSTRKTS